MKEIPIPLLIVWAIFSLVVLILGAAFAGGIEKIFAIPEGGDWISNIIWAFVWIIIIAPFPFLIIRFFGKKIK